MIRSELVKRLKKHRRAFFVKVDGTQMWVRVWKEDLIRAVEREYKADAETGLTAIVVETPQGSELSLDSDIS